MPKSRGGTNSPGGRSIRTTKALPIGARIETLTACLCHRTICHAGGRRVPRRIHACLPGPQRRSAGGEQSSVTAQKWAFILPIHLLLFLSIHARRRMASAARGAHRHVVALGHCVYFGYA